MSKTIKTTTKKKTKATKEKTIKSSNNKTTKNGSLFPIIIVAIIIVVIAVFMFINKGMKNEGNNSSILIETTINETIVETNEVKVAIVGIKVNEDGNSSYIKGNGEIAKSEWITIDGEKYYFDANGNMVKMQIIDEEYLVGLDGALLKNHWFKYPDGKDYYYFGDDGKKVKDAWVEYEGQKYYLNPDGVMDGP